jgi:non-specific serine/threonine protein kinase
VSLAEDTELNRKVALKFLSSHLCQDADCRTRFKREAQAAAKLDHPNIVAVHEVGEFQGRPFFTMQHIEGRSLREYEHQQELTIPQVLEIGIQIAEGLQAAHEKGVTHRDVKPSNVLIDSHGRARILDFGLASVAGTEHLTKTGSTLGTIGYMSPEQVRGEQVDQRTDILELFCMN